MLTKADVVDLVNKGTLALSVQQPWAALLALGLKWVENRTWRCPGWAIGTRILLHTGLKPDRYELDSPRQPIRDAAWGIFEEVGGDKADFDRMADANPDVFKLGGIVGAVTVEKCIQDDDDCPWAAPDAWHWVMADAEPSEFVPCKGALGLFQPEVK